MPDASIRIDGRAASEPRFGQHNGQPVANVRILAGRSKKDDQGNWQTLSTTAYDAAFWGAHHDLIAGLGIGKGDTVIVTGNVTGVESYQGSNGESLSVKVSGHGIQHFPKQGGGGGYQQPQQSQGAGWTDQQGQGGFNQDPPW